VGKELFCVVDKEKAGKVYLVFERHAVESNIDQLIRVKRASSMGAINALGSLEEVMSSTD
jgi:hypothetical protein